MRKIRSLMIEDREQGSLASHNRDTAEKALLNMGWTPPIFSGAAGLNLKNQLEGADKLARDVADKVRTAVREAEKLDSPQLVTKLMQVTRHKMPLSRTWMYYFTPRAGVTLGDKDGPKLKELLEKLLGLGWEAPMGLENRRPTNAVDLAIRDFVEEPKPTAKFLWANPTGQGIKFTFEVAGYKQTTTNRDVTVSDLSLENWGYTKQEPSETIAIQTVEHSERQDGLVLGFRLPGHTKPSKFKVFDRALARLGYHKRDPHDDQIDSVRHAFEGLTKATQDVTEGFRGLAGAGKSFVGVSTPCHEAGWDPWWMDPKALQVDPIGWEPLSEPISDAEKETFEVWYTGAKLTKNDLLGLFIRALRWATAHKDYGFPIPKVRLLQEIEQLKKDLAKAEHTVATQKTRIQEAESSRNEAWRSRDEYKNRMAGGAWITPDALQALQTCGEVLSDYRTQNAFAWSTRADDAIAAWKKVVARSSGLEA